MPRKSKKKPATGTKTSTSGGRRIIPDTSADDAIAHAKVAYDPNLSDQAIEHAISKTAIARAGFSYRFDGDSPISHPSTDGNVSVQSIFVASKTGFSIEKTIIPSGPHKGRFALVFDPFPAKKNVFRFMDLPAEIRIMVYRLLVVRPEKFVLSGSNRKCAFKCYHSRELRGLVMLQINNDIRQEAMAVFMRENVFDFLKTSLVDKFMSLYGDNSNMIRRIEISGQLCRSSFAKCARALARASHLQTLVLPSSRFIRRHLVSMLRPWFLEQGLTLGNPAEQVREAADLLIDIVDIQEYCADCRGCHGKDYEKTCSLCDGSCICHQQVLEGLAEVKADFLLMLNLE